MTPRAVEHSPDTIVLVHGFWVTPRSWEHWIPHYEAKGYRVLAPAYPGLEVPGPDHTDLIRREREPTVGGHHGAKDEGFVSLQQANEATRLQIPDFKIGSPRFSPSCFGAIRCGSCKNIPWSKSIDRY